MQFRCCNGLMPSPTPLPASAFHWFAEHWLHADEMRCSESLPLQLISYLA
ncbi:hypothetical protein C2845_PM05G19620 [Panicum miliaceum]|uniref:Uncharacterized protein n=1 Tax=Panicum miliaceum TaxID=4540 RepID=A0A3L6SYQ2_PANMI|nr:hypothetical protein C2845_PM05G19620 [Panicum miliaceum]